MNAKQRRKFVRKHKDLLNQNTAIARLEGRQPLVEWMKRQMHRHPHPNIATFVVAKHLSRTQGLPDFTYGEMK